MRSARTRPRGIEPRNRWAGACYLGLPLLLLAPTLEAATSARLDFNRDIHPILSENCFACHGPDPAKRKAGLRLDQKEKAFGPAKSGQVPLAPGRPEKSELYRRISTPDEDDRMPPAKSGKRLSAAQVETLRRWIEQGAEYRPHWAFILPEQPPLPPVKNTSWPRNPIDAFVLARLEAEGLKPSPEAGRRTLIRRLSLDLTGLPPTPEEGEAFILDNRPEAYERLVDRLLASPHYGERMALDWLDAARFADTHGYHIDPGRDMTHWREWVIAAFNQNLPFDEFTIEQIAGDLLPNATREQKVASGFNRNHMINFEGGAIPEEYHTAYIVDRVNTTSTVWLGLTVACAQCHDHKYDPITQRDYYRFYAFFNHVPENGLDGQKGNAVPLLPLPTPKMEAQSAHFKAEQEAAEKQLKRLEDDLPARQAAWEKDRLRQPVEWVEPGGLLARLEFEEHGAIDRAKGAQALAYYGAQPPRLVPGKEGEGIQLNGKDEWLEGLLDWGGDRDQAFSYGAWIKYQGPGGAVLSKMEASFRGFDLVVLDKRIAVHLVSQWPKEALKVQTKESFPADTWLHVFVTYDGSSQAKGLRIYVNGTPRQLETKNNQLTESILNSAPLRIGKRFDVPLFEGVIDQVQFYSRALTGADVAALAGRPFLQLVTVPPAQRTASEAKELERYFRETQDAELLQAQQGLGRVRQQRADFEKTIPTTMVMQEMAQPRDTFMLIRGQYDQHGEKVSPDVPACLGDLPEGAPPNRLGLARWLVSRRQPLTARVIVNRYWQMYFGTGLVKTAENFGSQGEWPSHAHLLDWLAIQFMESGWDVKAMQKLIVTSATYRQASVTTPDLLARDPENRLLARGPRFRLPAEFIRDQALAISGLLNPTIGGPSVSPYQPPGLWSELAYRDDGKNWTAQFYEQSHGADLYRRSMYTFWKRTSPPPTLTTFDAPDREVCTVRRAITDTPLQALVLMNDPTYLEAGRKLAERLLTQAHSDPARLSLAFRLALARPPDLREQATLLRLCQDQAAWYAQHRQAALDLLKAGEAPRNDKLDPAQVAAWTIIANVLLNLDETITKG